MGLRFYSLFPVPYPLFFGCSGTRGNNALPGLASQMKD
jgi:hypothetical protein